jgi:hypothetical protein
LQVSGASLILRSLLICGCSAGLFRCIAAGFNGWVACNCGVGAAFAAIIGVEMIKLRTMVKPLDAATILLRIGFPYSLLAGMPSPAQTNAGNLTASRRADAEGMARHDGSGIHQVLGIPRKGC